MKINFISAVAMMTVLATGCSTLVPVPEGDKLVWSSKEEVPQWSVLPSPMIDEADIGGVDTRVYRFSGISMRHASERIARETAINNATANLVRYVNQRVNASVDETYQSRASETQMTNGSLTINNN